MAPARPRPMLEPERPRPRRRPTSPAPLPVGPVPAPPLPFHSTTEAKKNMFHRAVDFGHKSFPTSKPLEINRPRGCGCPPQPCPDLCPSFRPQLCPPVSTLFPPPCIPGPPPPPPPPTLPLGAQKPPILPSPFLAPSPPSRVARGGGGLLLTFLNLDPGGTVPSVRARDCGADRHP